MRRWVFEFLQFRNEFEYLDTVLLRAHVESQVDLQIEEVFLDTVDQHAHVDAMQIQWLHLDDNDNLERIAAEFMLADCDIAG